ncbi:anti-CBASS protein Acb1 family protein [Sphingomonas sp. NPDC019816]|uniref:phage portal protein n=1 Tax=Sphingomonas sp. NPDC019816 TaxID=3390679 RepID=UPI003D068595
MAWITDSLTRAIAAVVSPLSRFGNRSTFGSYGVFNYQLAIAAYQSSGLLRKVIAIPANDRVREWRDWQADGDLAGKIEAEEKRLGLIAKVRQAETLRGIGGGALILITAGDHSQPLDPETINAGGLVAVNVVSRWQIRGDGWIREITDPRYGEPTRFLMDTDGRSVPIHPSRVVCFRGPTLPVGSLLTDEEAFWGDSRLLTVLREAENSDNAQAWFAALIKKAKLTRVGIGNLSERVATPEGYSKIAARVGLLAEGENSLNASVYDLGNGTDLPAEKIDDFTMTWNGIPAMMDAFLQMVATVADIPFTRLTGRSPAGMNATGAYDDQNWAKTVSAGQQLETRPCLDQIDPVLLRSAGITDPDKVSWKWAPLWAPTEKEDADTFYVFTQAVEKLQGTGTIPDQALVKAVQNTLSDRESWLVGIDAALAEIPESERFGLDPEDDGTDPSAIQAKGGDPESQATAGGDGSAPARRAANDAAPRSLYVSRKVKNVGDLQAWAKSQGLPDLQDDLHVTIAYSTTPVDWIKMGGEWGSDEDGGLTVPAGGPRLVEPLGDRTAVLLFASSGLSYRNMSMREAGASWDHSDYQPHISLTGDPVDLANVEPYRGPIEFGPEIFEEID